jgi:hypothetical protein
MVFESQEENDLMLENAKMACDIGSLVFMEKEGYGLMEDCFSPKNFSKTIHYWHNVQIPKNTPGVVVEFFGIAGIAFANVCWGGKMDGKKLVVNVDKITKKI